jgi:adenosylcobyric acid synthase
LARAANIPVVLLGDIDKGGVFASFIGSLALLDDLDRRLVKAFIINKFRGDFGILRAGLREFEERTNRPILGVIPWLDAVWIDAEDSLSTQTSRLAGPRAVGGDVLDVVVVAYKRMSNFTDFDALIAEPGVRLRYSLAASDILQAHLCILPGSKHTVGDLAQVRALGLDAVLRERARRELPIVGVCAGYQMLGETIRDEHESKTGDVPGLGLLPVRTTFGASKVLSNRDGSTPWLGDAVVSGYQIHNGRVLNDRAPMLIRSDGGDDGAVVGNVAGTSWHGVFDGDPFREALLGWVAMTYGVDWKPAGIRFDDLRDAQIEGIADALQSSIDLAMLERIVEARPL